MTKCYMVRHQKAGILSARVFAKPPTAEQIAPIILECDRLHKGGWTRIVEADLIIDEVPEANIPDGETDNTAALSHFAIEGAGTVTNPE